MRMDRLEIDERPLATGYFLLDTMRTLFMSGISPSECMHIAVGLVTEDELAEFKKHGIDVFVAPQPIEDLAALYKLLVQVSNGDSE